MRDRLDAYARDAISLRALVSDLEALIQALEPPGTPLAREFRGIWGGLEEIYACTIDNHLPDIPHEELARHIGPIVQEMERKIVGALESNQPGDTTDTRENR